VLLGQFHIRGQCKGFLSTCRDVEPDPIVRLQHVVIGDFTLKDGGGDYAESLLWLNELELPAVTKLYIRCNVSYREYIRICAGNRVVNFEADSSPKAGPS
jgi:hypothetical protein